MTKAEVRTEVVAGITTFFTMAYVVIVNPSILSTSGTGMSYTGVLTATVCLAFLMTLLMGLYAKLPFAVAPGMGINAFFTFTVILGQKVPWQTALGAIFWAGALFVLISLTPVREMIARAIPLGIRNAAAAGIGIFLTFLGLRNAGLVVSDPVTFVKLGQIDQKALLAIGGLLVMVWLVRRKNPFAFLIAMASVTVIAWSVGLVPSPSTVFSKPDFESVFLKVDILGSLKLALLPTMISILFTDLFDSISTFIGVAQASRLLDDQGEPLNLREGLIVDALATLGAGLLGTSSGTAYLESSAGIEVGGRSGLTAVVTALCFLPCLFLAPLAAMVPAFATAPVLIFVGSMMFRSVASLQFDKIEDALPAFLTIILIPLTFSITQGILWGFISHVALYGLAGRAREVKPMMYSIAGLSVVLLAIQQGR